MHNSEWDVSLDINSVGEHHMNRILMRTVVEAIMFLELSGDDVIDPDAAVRQLEEIAANVQELSLEEREIFLMYVDELAAEKTHQGYSEREAAFLRELPEVLGLTLP